MLNAIRQTNALAVHGTPELQQAFGEWLKVLEGKAETLLAQGPQDAAGLAKSLSVSEASANYILARLAQGGKITLTGKSKS
jgi:predicted transcriptional regulator